MARQPADTATAWRRMQRRIAKSSTCWVWTGAVSGSGYGSVRANGIVTTTHRVAYEAVNGPVPDGQEVDHDCRNKLCCNPAHLVAMTHQANLDRRVFTGTRARATHCKRGHSFDRAYVRPNGRRECRTCKNATARDAYAAAS